MAEKTLSYNKELQALGEGELNEQLQKLSQEMWQHKAKLRQGAETKTHRSQLLRNQMARIQTALRQRTKVDATAARQPVEKGANA